MKAGVEAPASKAGTTTEQLLLFMAGCDAKCRHVQSEWLARLERLKNERKQTEIQ